MHPRRRRAHARQRFETCLIPRASSFRRTSRRRAHARQRFETEVVQATTRVSPFVGEELMRDSALKLSVRLRAPRHDERRRRAHARQRFETLVQRVHDAPAAVVGEELMRDSALKLSPLSVGRYAAHLCWSEKSSCATAL